MAATEAALPADSRTGMQPQMADAIALLRRAMFWRLVLQALRLRRQRVAVVFGALAVGAAIVTAMAAVYFDINVKMSQELRSFGANFYIGPGGTGRMPEADYDAVLAAAPTGLVAAASPYLYGMARTEKEKVVMLGLSFASWCPTGRSPATGSASISTTAAPCSGASWPSAWNCSPAAR